MNILQRSSTPKSLNNTKKRTVLLYLALFAILILCFTAAVFFGSAETDVFEAVKALINGDKESSAFRIIFYVRLPRVLGAALSGTALAVAGVIIQAVLNNAMAAPNIIGVNSGAGLAAVILIALFPSAVGLLPIAAFLGALSASLIIYFIAAKTGAGRMTITLTGIAVSSILTAGINLVKTLFPDSLYDANSFLVGGLSGLTLSDLFPACLLILLGIILSFLISRGIDILSLGEETASGLGMNVGRFRFILLVLASVLAGSAVSFAGLLGFVGLVVPHIGRRFVGTDHKKLIPFCALGGASLVIFCDMLARLLFAPYELPVGIILSFIGGPFFILLILTKKRGGLND